MSEANKKRAELIASFDAGQVRGPLVALLVPALVGMGVSYGVSFIVRALSPKPPLPEQGRREGEFSITRSAQGEFVTEVFGGDTSDGSWAASTVYAQYATVAVSGRWYMAETGGTSGGSQPAWPTTRGNAVADNTVTWRDMGKTGYGVRVAPIIIYTSGLRKRENITRQEVGGGKGLGGNRTQEVRQITYDIDVALAWGRGPLTLLKEWAYAEVVRDLIPITGNWTGIVDADVDDDDDYDQDNLPDPAIAYVRPGERHGGALALDGFGVRSGVMTHGGYSNVWDYPGNETQLPDPTVEADIDARYGSGSTPAYRKRAYTLHKLFSLTRWGGTFPQMTGLLANQTYKKLNQICDQWCEREGLGVGDYDFTALAPVRSRGILIAGGKYAPADMMETCAHVYGAVYSKNIYFYESDKIYGVFGDATPTVTIPDTEMGWIDGEREDGGLFVEVESEFPPETELARRAELKYIDPEKDYEVNAQSSARQVTSGAHEKVSEVNITLTDEEARSVTDRDLYQAHLRKPRRFTLSWTYAWLDPGTIIYVTRDEGIYLTLQLESITGGVGVLECEAFDVDSAVIVQSARTSGGTQFEVPPVPIPASSVAVLLDTPLLRDKDITENDALGFYWGAVPRTADDQTWPGASLWVDKVGWEKIAETTLPATVGKVVATNIVSTPSHYALDAVGTVTVDLYGTERGLESVTAADIDGGANGAAIGGDKVIQFMDAVRVGGHPNRWTISNIYWGRRGTEKLLAVPAVGETFVLLNEAVQFVPRPRSEAGTTLALKAVTSGQSLDDAAQIEWPWLGRSLMPLAIAGIDTDETTQKAPRDSEGSILITARPRSNFAAVGDEYRIRFLSDDGLTEVHSISFKEGVATAALLESDGVNKYANITKNTLTKAGGAATVRGRSLQVVRHTGNYVEATLKSDSDADTTIGYVGPAKDWRGGNPQTLADYQITLAFDGVSTYNLQARVNGVIVGTVNPSFAEYEAGIRVRITLSGTEVRFYRDWQSPSTPPFARSPVAPSFPLRAFAAVSVNPGSVEKVVMTTDPYPTTIFSADQQTEYYGTLKDPVRVSIEQYSGIREVGYGFEWTGLI